MWRHPVQNRPWNGECRGHAFHVPFVKGVDVAMYGGQRVHGDCFQSCHTLYLFRRFFVWSDFAAQQGLAQLLSQHSSAGLSHAGKVAKRLDSGEEEISAASYRRERGYPSNLFLDGPLRNRQIVRTILSAEDGITLIPQLVEVRIVGPHVHGKLELTDKAGTAHEGRNSPFYPILGSTLRKRGTVSAATANHLPPIHICRGVSRVHPPNVRSQRTTIAMRVHGSE